MKDLRNFADFRDIYCITMAEHHWCTSIHTSNAAALSAYTNMWFKSCSTISVYQYVWNLISGNFARFPDSAKPMVEFWCFFVFFFLETTFIAVRNHLQNDTLSLTTVKALCQACHVYRYVFLTLTI